jgi:hypothetical protein
MSRAAMGEVIVGKNTPDGTDGGQRINAFFVQIAMNGFSPAWQSMIIEMEPFHDNNLLYLVRRINTHGISPKAT